MQNRNEELKKNIYETSFKLGFGLILLTFVEIGISLISSVLIPLFTADQISVRTFFSALIEGMGQLLIFLVFFSKSEQSLTWKSKTNPFLTVLIGSGLALFLNLVFANISSFINGVFGSKSINASNLITDIFVVDLLTIAIIPAIFEEMIFRGLIFTSIRKFGLREALFGSSLIFSLAHLNINQGIFAFISGYVLALSYEVSGKLIYPILIHMVNNLVSVIIVYYYGNKSPLSLYIYIGLAILLFFLFVFSRKDSIKDLFSTKKESFFKTFFLSPTMFVYLVYSLILLIVNTFSGVF